MTLDRSQVHEGLPDDSPWPIRVALRSRAFLVATGIVTLTHSVVATVSPEWLLNFDEPVSQWARQGEADPWLSMMVTQLGSPALAAALAGIAAAVLWHRCRASALTLGALIAAAFSVDVGLKIIVDRARPPDPVVRTILGSFPSGHVIHAVVIFGLVPFVWWILTYRRSLLRLGLILFGLVVVSVAVSRVRLGAHWPSDVISSVPIGLFLLLGAERLLTSTWAADRCALAGHHTMGSGGSPEYP